MSCTSDNAYNLTGNVRAIGDIIGPAAAGGGKSTFTLEIAPGKQVDFLHPSKIDNSATTIGIGVMAQQMSPSAFTYGNALL